MLFAHVGADHDLMPDPSHTCYLIKQEHSESADLLNQNSSLPPYYQDSLFGESAW